LNRVRGALTQALDSIWIFGYIDIDWIAQRNKLHTFRGACCVWWCGGVLWCAGAGMWLILPCPPALGLGHVRLFVRVRTFDPLIAID